MLMILAVAFGQFTACRQIGKEAAKWLTMENRKTRALWKSAKRREFMTGHRKLLFAIIGAPVFAAPRAFAAASAPDSIRLANDVVPAPFGYEAVTTQYVVAEPTPLYVSP